MPHPMSREREELLTENLILGSVGSVPYLKLPERFRERYPFKPDQMPNPVAFLEESDGEVSLRYKWSREEIDAQIKKSQEEDES